MAPSKNKRAGDCQLTQREIQILRLIASGFTGREIAGKLHISFKNEVAYGVPAGSEPSVPPALPGAPAPPPSVDPGVFTRALSIANRIKKHKDYTVADGELLGLEGAEITPPDLANIRPVLKLATAGSSAVNVGWKKQGMAGVKIWVKRGTGDFAYLAFDTTTPSYVDTFPFPAAEEKWTYKAIYHFGGGRVGLWSEEVSITVKA